MFSGVFVKEHLKNLLTISMNEIFLSLTCYSQKFNLLFWNQGKNQHRLCERMWRRWNKSNLFNSDIYNLFQLVLACDHSQITILTLYTSLLYTYFLKICNMIFKTWMGKWRTVIADLKQVVQKERGRTNRMIKQK